ncbi:hypothetical protein [Gandjariella thermophila]|uniref:Uncharacterized protein n=1 Tax=Gandjariella thermophila TaxID=1931992 RepID=A0A4D4J8F8_9PSEU|nr:hypothetical protein [Gandjariella thermophila]GDY31804.1 hypothetical protein GTS_34370 [Gandjariella thermophila]
MSENLIESVAAQLAPPVTRKPSGAASTDESVGQSILGITLPILGITFADEGDE